MNIVQPYARIYHFDGMTPSTFGINLLRRVEGIARVSHRSEDAQTADSYKTVLSAIIIQHGDWSVTEHASITVEAYVDRGVTHEWVRHRLGAYTQESTRFVNYTKKIGLNFIVPDNMSTNDVFNLTNTLDACERGYNKAVESGVTPQIARAMLPNALASKLLVTYNLRSWRHFFIMRTTKETHPQMRRVTIPLLGEFQSVVPILYDDIIPNARQADNLRLPR